MLLASPPFVDRAAVPVEQDHAFGSASETFAVPARALVPEPFETFAPAAPFPALAPKPARDAPAAAFVAMPGSGPDRRTVLRALDVLERLDALRAGTDETLRIVAAARVLTAAV